MPVQVEQINNYHERLVIDRVHALAPQHPDFTSDMLTDVVCVALNKLAPRYIRHTVDLVFYMPEEERRAMYNGMEDAVNQAFALVGSHTAR